MKSPQDRIRFRDLDLDPIHWVREILRVLGLALQRLWGRDVMLYVGGVSFFILLAVFPGLAILIGLFSLLLTPEQAAYQADKLSFLMPSGARPIFQSELARLAHAPEKAISAQSAVVLVIGLYAAHRGFKALLAGLSFIHEEEDQRGFFGFNFMALVVLVAAFVLLFVMSGVFLVFRLLASTLNLRPLAGASWIQSEWTWASLGLMVGMTLIYRYAMSRAPVGWRASMAGGVRRGGDVRVHVLGQRLLCRAGGASGRDLRLDLGGDHLPDLAVVERQRRVLRRRPGHRDGDRAGRAAPGPARGTRAHSAQGAFATRKLIAPFGASTISSTVAPALAAKCGTSMRASGSSASRRTKPPAGASSRARRRRRVGTGQRWPRASIRRS
jgi:membrane protein